MWATHRALQLSGLFTVIHHRTGNGVCADQGYSGRSWESSMSRGGHRGGGWFGFGGDGDDEPRARSVLKFQWSLPPPPSHGACGQRHTWGSDRRCDPSGLGSTQGGRRGLAGADAQPLALSQPGFDSRPDETSRASSLRGFGQQRPAGQHSRNLAPSRGSLSTQAWQ